MSLRQDIHDNLMDNPLTWREFITLFRQRGTWFWRIIYTLTALLFIAPLAWINHRYLDEAVDFVMGLLIFANIFIFPLVVVRSIMIANESVARERRGRTWDLLMLTGVGTWRVVLGKWLGTLRFLLRDYLWLFVLRIGTLFWVMVESSMGYTSTYEVARIDFSYWGWNSFALVIGIVLGFTVLEMLFSSALGIATAFFNWRTRTGGGVAIAARVGLAIALFFGTIYAVGYFNFDDPPDYKNQTEEFIITFATTFADNGMVNSSRLLVGNYSYGDGSKEAIQLALLVNALLYLVLTGVALEIARTVAWHVGVNNPGAPGVKPAHKKKRQLDETPQPQPINERTIALPHGKGNAFELQQPEQFRAEVYHYQRRLGRMYLRLTHDSEPTYVQLSNVAYIDAPSVWTGAHFRTAAQPEYEAFVQEKRLTISNLTADSMRLYVLDGDNPVRIVAGTAQTIDELPTNI